MRYWPDHPDMDWPAALPNIGDSLDAFEALFKSLGYEECDSPDLEEGIEKIAIYAYADGEPARTARQVESGRWASKMGLSDKDIEHDTLEDVGGEGSYGSPVKIMRRPRA